MATQLAEGEVYELTTPALSVVKVWYRFNDESQERLLEQLTGAAKKKYGPYVRPFQIRVEVIEGSFTFKIFTGSTISEVSLSNVLKG